MEEKARAGRAGGVFPVSGSELERFRTQARKDTADMTVATLSCIMVTLCVLFYVFYLPGRLHLGPEKTRLAYLQERKEAIYENLRDLNFEHQAGKLPDQDYQSLKLSLEEEAAGVLAEMATLEQVTAAGLLRQKRSAEFEGSPQELSSPRSPSC